MPQTQIGLTNVVSRGLLTRRELQRDTEARSA